MKLYNTLTRSMEEFVPQKEREVTFYQCGPTVYWTQHIGNLRAMTIGDLLVRSLTYIGYKVTHIRNYTDVGHMTSDADTGEDKLEKGAKREGTTPDKVAEKYINIFEHDVAALNLVSPTHTPRATACIDEMIEMVGELLVKGHAYTTDLAVYFDVSTYPKYTQLSGQNMDKLMHGSGKADVQDPAKKHAADFALWFFRAGSHANAIQYWPSPFPSTLVANGVGFPGWHIECSAMCRKYLGKTVDIHMGGVEHIPIHHTNEIAQSECANGVQFVRYWLHNEHLVVSEQKMAKSRGTGMSLEEVVQKEFDPLALRYFYLTSHYRTRQNFTWEALANAANSYRSLVTHVVTIRSQAQSRTTLSPSKMDKISVFQNRFRQAIDDDLNIPTALAIAWEVVKSNIPAGDKLDILYDFDDILGLNLRSAAPQARHVDEIPAHIQELLDTREQYRKKGDFAKADEIRGELEKQGYHVEDTPDGQKLIERSVEA